MLHFKLECGEQRLVAYIQSIRLTKQLRLDADWPLERVMRLLKRDDGPEWLEEKREYDRICDVDVRTLISWFLSFETEHVVDETFVVDEMYLEKFKEYVCCAKSPSWELFYAIQQAKALMPEILSRFELKELIESDIGRYDELIAREAILKKTSRQRQNPNVYQDSLLYFDSYYQGLQAALKTLNSPIDQLSTIEREIVVNHFPILFGSCYPWVQSTNELNYVGPIALGEGLSHIIVPSDKTGLIREWVQKYVARERKPSVISLDDFYQQYPEAVDRVPTAPSC